jgi:hypothetical protein
MASTIRRISVSSAPQESARDLLEFDSGERHLLVRSMDGSYDAGGSAGSQVGSHSLWTAVDTHGHRLEIYGFGGWGLPRGGRCEFCGACHILRRSTPRPVCERGVSCSRDTGGARRSALEASAQFPRALSRGIQRVDQIDPTIKSVSPCVSWGQISRERRAVLVLGVDSYS